jgi:hypothetical protein
MTSGSRRPGFLRKHQLLIALVTVLAGAVVVGAVTYNLTRPALPVPPIIPAPGTGNNSGGGGSEPPGQLALGAANPFTVRPGGVPAGGCQVPPAGTTHYCYSIEVGTSSPGLSTADLAFNIRTPASGFATLGSVTLEEIGGRGIAIYTTNGGWVGCTTALCGMDVASGTLPVTLSSTQTLILFAGSSTVSGDTLNALFVGSFSGAQPDPLP